MAAVEGDCLGEAFERELAQALGARHAVAVGNGTDAIHLALRARGVGPGDEVVTTSISAAFSALAILQAAAGSMLSVPGSTSTNTGRVSPRFSTWPSAASPAPARRNASVTSSTWLKSRFWEPSPKIWISSPRAALRTNQPMKPCRLWRISWRGP